MRKIILLLIILITNNSYSQEKWRALTLSSVSGIDLSRNKFTTLSAGLHYDLERKYFLSSWTGLFVQTNPKTTNSWFSTQTTINRYMGKWNVGLGVQYGSVQTPNISYFTNNNTFLITNVSYRVKFK